MKKQKYGLLALLVKLGPKLYPLFKSLGDELLIFGKTLMGAAGATAAASAGIYAYLFTWQTGLGLIAFLIMHEYGHVWAMRKSGIKTKGMYFIPFMGAVAVMDELVHRARDEAFISIMGPVFGLVLFVLPCYIWWYLTGSEIAAAITALSAFINVINLLPIMPLDGGRMLKSICYSQKAAASLAFIVLISTLTALGAWYVGFTLFALMAVIGFGELFALFGIGHLMRNVLATLFRAVIVFIVWAIAWPKEQKVDLDAVAPIADGSWVGSAIMTTFIAIATIGLMFLLFTDVKRLSKSNESYIVSLVLYPVRILESAWLGLWELANLRGEHIQTGNYEPMVQNARFLYAVLTIILIAMHFVVMMQLNDTTTGAIFGDIMK